MQLSVREVANLFMVSEQTVYRWLKQKQIPASKVLDQYRFNRAELLEWATAQKLPISPEVFSQAEEKTENLPTLLEAMKSGGIYYRLLGKDKSTVLASVVQSLQLPDNVDRDFLLKVLLAREELGSTGIGEGIAIPHVRNPIVLDVPRSFIALCFLNEPVDFGAIDRQPVHCLFTLITPTVRVHLHLLSRLSYALRDAAFHELILRQGTAEQIYSQLLIVENQISGSGQPKSPRTSK